MSGRGCRQEQEGSGAGGGQGGADPTESVRCASQTMTPTVVPFFIAHQGCPHQCVFCNQLQIAGTAGGLPTTAEIEQKIATWFASSGCQALEVAYFGGTFTGLAPADQ